MILLILARKLKEAGLKCVQNDDIELYWVNEADQVMYVGPGYDPEPEDVWIPRLDQLLAEIERKRYGYNLHTLTTKHDHKYYCSIKLLECDCGYRIDNISWGPFKGDAPEVAAGSGLLWILEQEKGGKLKCSN